MTRWRQCCKALLIALLFGIGLFAVGILYPLCEMLPRNRGLPVRDAIQVAWYRALCRVLGVRIRRFGQALPEPVMWVANHISWLDIVVLGAQSPLTFIAKSEVGRWPVIGFMARRTRTLLVRRGDAASSRQTAEAMVWLLRQQRRVMLFPEGTSTVGERVLRFHARLFQPATLVGGSVQAIALAYRGDARILAPFVGDDEFLPHLWTLLTVPEIGVDLTFCEPLSTAGQSREQLARRAFQQVSAALGLPSLTQGSARSGTGKFVQGARTLQV